MSTSSCMTQKGWLQLVLLLKRLSICPGSSAAEGLDSELSAWLRRARVQLADLLELLHNAHTARGVLLACNCRSIQQAEVDHCTLQCLNGCWSA